MWRQPRITRITDHVTRKEGREEPIRLQQANEESQPPMDTNEHEFINQFSIDSPATVKPWRRLVLIGGNSD